MMRFRFVCLFRSASHQPCGFCFSGLYQRDAMAAQSNPTSHVLALRTNTTARLAVRAEARVARSVLRYTRDSIAVGGDPWCW